MQAEAWLCPLLMVMVVLFMSMSVYAFSALWLVHFPACGETYFTHTQAFHTYPYAHTNIY